MKTKKDKLSEKKQKMKAKMAAKKAKIGKASKVVAVLALALALVGCGAIPKSRANDSEMGDQEGTVEVHIAENAYSNSVCIVQRIVAGDVGYQAADSAGSTETQTANPAWTFPIKIDARYNDALAAANATSQSTLSSLGSGIGAVLDLMVAKKSGTVQATTKDGTPVTVQCDNGQCSICEDCGDK